MCGIAGFFDKSGDNRNSNVGQVLIAMLEGLGCRGPDSAGVALFGTSADHRAVLRVKLGDEEDCSGLIQTLTQFLDSHYGGSYQFSNIGNSARVVVGGVEDLPALAARIEALSKEIEVVSMGTSLEIIKQVGSPTNLEKTYGVSRLSGTHGLGHTRLSTESKVDLSHSQPFGSHQLPDLAIVHNGHITNYHQLRRCYEQRKVRFYTENDSEVVAIYLADQISQGSTLAQALEAMLRELDGSFSCLVATAKQFGFVKDPFALKPLLWTETGSFVALANEEIAIRAALPGDYDVREAQAREVRVWDR
ncbi:MAG: glutamine phosphoribosylpyrophosphate amidotransferase [Terriglobia bacterium]